MSDLVVDCIDPRAREAELKDLFARNGKPAFADVFERAYRPRAEQGLRSWIGVAGDRVVMQISVSPVRFRVGDRVLQGGVLGDLMVDDGHRDFWGPVRMLRKLLSDLKRGGQSDFLITTTTADAEPLFKAGGFKPLGLLRRFLLPLYQPYLGVFGLTSGGGLRPSPPRVMPEPDNGALPGTFGHSDCFRPEPVTAFYETRMSRVAFADATWLEIPARSGSGRGYALVSRNTQLPRDLSLADAFWNDPAVSLAQVVHATARWARTQRFRGLRVTTLQEARATQQLRKTGFVPRQILTNLLINQLRPVDLPPVEQWFLTSFSLSSW